MKEVQCKVADETDVVVIDLQTPNKTNWLSFEQEIYLDRWEEIHVSTQVFKCDADKLLLLIIISKQSYKSCREVIEPNSPYNFATMATQNIGSTHSRTTKGRHNANTVK